MTRVIGKAEPEVPPMPLGRGAARGVVAAMAMSGWRQLAAGLGLVEQTPPEAILQEGVPVLLRHVPEDRRTATIELLHWTYGGVAGAAFATLPARLRRWRITGPLYGLATWAVFQFGIAPALHLSHVRQSGPWERAMLMADHVLYGVVVGTPPVSADGGTGREQAESEAGTATTRDE